MLDKLTGVDHVVPRWRLGIPGHDMAPHFAVTRIVEAPNGLDTLEELAVLKTMATDAHLKFVDPGALTFT